MRRMDDQPTTRRRASVREAAEELGISVDAVRGRIKRGSLAHGKAEDGSVYVWLETDHPQLDDDQDADQPQLDDQAQLGDNQGGDQSPLIEALQDEVAYLRAQARVRDEEIRRRDHLLAAALERIPPRWSPHQTPHATLDAPRRSRRQRRLTLIPPPHRRPHIAPGGGGFWEVSGSRIPSMPRPLDAACHSVQKAGTAYCAIPLESQQRLPRGSLDPRACAMRSSSAWC